VNEGRRNFERLSSLHINLHRRLRSLIESINQSLLVIGFSGSFGLALIVSPTKAVASIMLAGGKGLTKA
jgi:hypothetical protein